MTTLLFAACNKDEDITFDVDAKIAFSTDSVLFDTVFTAIGSSTRRLKIYNPNSKAIIINSIKLSGGNTSAYSLNINGFATTETSELKINGNDSINVFVKVNINPTLQNLPFIVEDSILFAFNGKKQNIPLVNLTIAAGTRILFHGNATMSIKGTLTAIGTKSDTILFASDRLEQLYKDETGQWNGLHFYPDSKDSQINYAIIKNGIAGITVDSLSLNSKPKLLLTNSIIKNMEVVGFLGYQTELTAFNNLFFNCGQYLLYGVGGGRYNLKQNTFAGYNINFARKTPVVYLSDYISNNQATNLTVDIVNNIVWGNLKDELLIDKKTPNTILIANIKNNLLKTSNVTFDLNGNIFNADPSFVNAEKGNFRLNATSP
ncbi:MAG: hypothetical protein EON51_16535, partial [Acinetobacter sp.]